MAKIERVEVFMVDLVPKVKRVDAIQSFVSQETPFVRILADDGAVGTGYTYTIGTGGPSVVELIARSLAPQLIGRDPTASRKSGRALFFHTHATAVGAITSLALAAIDTALWDMRCRRSGRPLHVEAGGAQTSVPLYTTEGGWLHLETSALVDDALKARAAGFGGSKIKVGRHPKEDVSRLEAVRKAVGDGFEIMVDGNQGAAVDEAIRRARLYEPFDLAWYEEPLPAEDLGGHIRLSASTSLPMAVGESHLQPLAFPRISAAGCVQRRAGGRRAHRRHHALAEDGASCRVLQRFGLPAFPDGAARQPDGGGAERALGRIHTAARRDHVHEDDDFGRSRCSSGSAWTRYRLGLGGHRQAPSRRAEPGDQMTNVDGGGRDRPLYQLICGVLREHIEDGSFPRGLVIGEAAVARAFSSGRVPAAMALRHLHKEGLLKQFEGRGYLSNPEKNTSPIRRDLGDAGLRLPANLGTGSVVRNRPRRIYPDVEHAVAACLSYGRFLLNESALAEHYQVSRTVAHEVLMRLERTGLVIQDRNQRWYAGPLTIDLLREHYEMRWLLEPIALGQALGALNPKEIALKEKRARRVSDGNLPARDREILERDLHVDIVLRCHNRQLRETIRRSQLPLIATHSTFEPLQHRDEIVKMISEHLTVFRHLRLGQSEAAMRALRNHLKRSVQPNIDLLSLLGTIPENLRPPYLLEV